MQEEIKIILGISTITFIVSMITSWFFGGYSPIIKVGANVLVLIPFLIGIIIPILVVVGIAIYGIISLFKKDYKLFLWAGIISLCLLVVLFAFSLPPLLVK